MVSPPSIAIVYDNLTTTHGGAEVVLHCLHQAFPQAQFYSTVQTVQPEWMQEKKATTSWLQRLPRMLAQKHQWQAIVAPMAIESLEISEDVVISVSAGVAKGVLTTPHQLHICYLLTPTRYLYDLEAEALVVHGLSALPGIRQAAQKAIAYVRWWDQAAVHRPDLIIAISKLVASRITKHYQLPANAIIYPPFIPKSTSPATTSLQLPLPNSLLFIGRLVWYKKVDILIQHALQYAVPTIIAGSGIDAARLKKCAGTAATFRQPNEPLRTAFQHWKPATQPVIFLGFVTDDEATRLLSHQKTVLCMPGIEDFGLTALEGVFANKPVIVNKLSGVSEILKPPALIPLSEATSAALHESWLQARSMTKSYPLLKKQALLYSDQQFIKQIKEFVTHHWESHSQKN